MAVTALVIDDSAAARQVISYHLRLIGCSIVGEAANAADALALFNKLRPDIVSLDLIMPIKDHVDSLALVRTIREQAPKTAIIIVSVVSSDEERFKGEGVFAFVTKPFNRYALASIGIRLARSFPGLTSAR